MVPRPVAELDHVAHGCVDYGGVKGHVILADRHGDGGGGGESRAGEEDGGGHEHGVLLGSVPRLNTLVTSFNVLRLGMAIAIPISSCSPLFVTISSYYPILV